MASGDDFKGLIEPVARELLGAPNPRLSSKKELRFGNHGSLSVDLEKDVWADHENGTGGGVLDLVAKLAGTNANGGATDWLREHGYLAREPEKRERKAAPKRGQRKLEATYSYVDETGEELFQSCRYLLLNDDGSQRITKDGKKDKTFLQRRRARGDEDARDGWVYTIKGVRQVPYRLPDLQEAIANETLVFLVEGEKKADRLAELGAPATCNAMGAKKWPAELSEFFKGADVVILPDNDDSGRGHAELVGAALKDVASRVRVLDLQGLPAKGDIVDWLDAGGTLERLYRDVELTARPFGEARLEAFASKFSAVWFQDIDSAPPKREWIIKNVFTVGDMGVAWGFSGGGKSFLILDCTLTIALAASGRVLEPKWFGYRVYPGGVVYCAPEGGQDLRLRIRAWREDHGIPAGTVLPFVLLPTAIDLASSEGDTDALIEEIKAHAARMTVPLRAVVIDTLSRAMAGRDENGSADMGAFIRNCEKIQKATGALVLPVHHAGNDRTKERGHTSLRAAVDTSIEIVKPEDGSDNYWIVRKQKGGKEGARHEFRLKQTTVGVDDEGDAITSCVVVPSETGTNAASRTARKPRRAPSREARLGLRALHDALDMHGEPAPGILELPHGIKVVKREHWRKRLVAALVEPDEDPASDKVRKRLSRVREELVDLRVIGQDEPYFWIAREPSE